MSNIDKQALREVAERATPGNWRRTSSLFNGITVTPFSLCGEEVTLAHTVEKRDAEFIAAANPATMLQAEPVTTANKLGNSQVHSDCCQEQSPIDHGYRPECECSGCKATARICAELTGNSPVIPEDLRRAAMLQANQRDLSQPVDPQVAEYEQIMLQAGNSPVTPDGWISCSERMPDNDESKPIAIFTGKCLDQGMFVATYDDDGFFDYWQGMEIIGVSHWMQLPAPPQK